jgi:hypothetical protein
MIEDFKRFGLEKFSTLTGILEICGGAGLLIGLFYLPILWISSGGLAMLMLLGVIFRLRSGDRLLSSFPAIFFLILNGYLFLFFLS